MSMGVHRGCVHFPYRLVTVLTTPKSGHIRGRQITQIEYFQNIESDSLHPYHPDSGIRLTELDHRNWTWHIEGCSNTP